MQTGLHDVCAVDFGGEANSGFAIDANSVPLVSGTRYGAEVMVRQLPSQNEMFSDRSINGGQGWFTPQEALAAALARGRRYVREQFLDQTSIKRRTT